MSLQIFFADLDPLGSGCRRVPNGFPNGRDRGFQGFSGGRIRALECAPISHIAENRLACWRQRNPRVPAAYSRRKEYPERPNPSRRRAWKDAAEWESKQGTCREKNYGPNIQAREPEAITRRGGKNRDSATRAEKISCGARLARLPEKGDAFGNIPVIDVHRVDLGKTAVCRCLFARQILRHSQIIPQREDGFLIQARRFQSPLVPDCGNRRLFLLHERQAQQRTTLHGVAKCRSLFRSFRD